MTNEGERIVPSKLQVVIVKVTLEEFQINEEGKKVELIRPQEVEAVVSSNDFTGLGHRDVKEEIPIKACDCLGFLHNAIRSGRIKL